MIYESFTTRQKEITDHILMGKTNEQICSDLHIALQTVKYHVTILYKKADVRSRSQFIIKLMNEIRTISQVAI